MGRGYYISLSGYFLKKGSGPELIRTCLRDNIIPLDKLMIETDAPYMGFTSCRDSFFSFENLEQFNSKKKKKLKQRTYPNVPSSIRLVFSQMLNLLNEGRQQRNELILEENQLAMILCQNAIDFFGFSQKLMQH